MAKNNVTLMHLQPGATWTFVHSNGKRTEYVYERQMVGRSPSPDGKNPGLDAMHALRNPVTGKCAQVSETWLRQGPLNSASSESGYQSHWLVGEKAPIETPEGALAA